jgi:hypothetical protein
MKSRSTVTTSFSLNWKWLQVLLMLPLGKLLKTFMMLLVRNRIVLWRETLLSLSETPHTKLANSLQSCELGGLFTPEEVEALTAPVLGLLRCVGGSVGNIQN